MNIIVLLALMTASGLSGFALRRWHISKIRAKLGRVEIEMIRSHKEILELQKECISLEQQLSDIRNPVISMNSPLHNNSNKKLPDAALRKKMLKNVRTIAQVVN